MGLDRRFLSPCRECVPGAAYYATLGSLTSERQERGNAPGTVVRSDENRGGIDLRLAKSPYAPILKHLEGEVVIQTSGDIDRARVLWKRLEERYYKGRSDFSDLAQPILLRTGTGIWVHHPDLVAMSNGELLVLWGENTTSDTTNTGWNFKARVVDPKTYGLSAIATLPSLSGSGYAVNRGLATPAIAGIAGAEDPSNPGRIVAVACAKSDNTIGTESYDFITFTSGDFGRTWKVSSLNRSMTGTSESGFGVDLLYYGSRLILSVQRAATTAGFWYSNDSGASWTAATVSVTASGRLSGGTAMCVTINGTLLAFCGTGGGVATPLASYASFDAGASWQGFTDPGITVGSTSTDNNGATPSAMVDDSGYVCLYWTAVNSATSAEGLFVIRSGTRTFTLSEVEAATNVFTAEAEEREATIYDDATATRDLSVQEISVANWRGRAAVCLQYNDTTRRGLLLTFANQPSDVRFYTYPPSVDGVASWYHWFLPLGFPNDYGTTGYAWTLTGTTGTSRLVEGGGFELADSGGAAQTYTSPTLVADPYVTRFVVRVLTGGSLAADDCTIEAASATSDTRWRMRLATTGFLLRDANGASNIAASVAVDLTLWHEFLVVTDSSANMVQCYWRRLDPENDGEFVAFNELLTSEVAMNTATPEGTNLYIFGHAAGAADVSEWRGIQQQRTQNAPNPVIRWDAADAFQGFDVTVGSGIFTTSDHGPEASDLPIYLANGLSVLFSGAGAVAGDRWEFATRHEFAKELALAGGPLYGWAAERQAINDTERINIVLDAGDGQRFRADSIGLFGCNAGLFQVALNDADDWNSATLPVNISAQYGAASSGTYIRRQEKVRSTTGTIDTALTVLSVDRNAVKVAGVLGNTTPLRPHQYRPRGTRTWYLATDPEAAAPGHVFRIVDNSPDAIYLSVEPSGQFVADDTIYVNSDRILFDLSTDASLDESIGYRFARISLQGQTVIHDDKEPYLKIGRIVLGRMQQIHDPDWGWSMRVESGVSVLRSPSGVVRASRVGPDLERYILSWPTMLAEVRDDDNIWRDRAVWQRLRDLLLASEFGLHSTVLVMDGIGLQQSAWLRATGDDIALGKLTGALDLRHHAYMSVEDCGQAIDGIGPIMDVGGLVFDEEA